MKALKAALRMAAGRSRIGMMTLGPHIRRVPWYPSHRPASSAKETSHQRKVMDESGPRSDR